MNKSDILDLNENIQSSIFAYNVSELPVQVTGFFEAIMASAILSGFTPGELRCFNRFFEGCLRSLQCKDYLNLADILQYEILPMLTRR